jgi:hypothetical protein
MIHVGMGDYEPEQRRIVTMDKPRHRGKRHVHAGLRPERASKVEDEAGAQGLQLDAVAADFVSAAMDPYPHPRLLRPRRSSGNFKSAKRVYAAGIPGNLISKIDP